MARRRRRDSKRNENQYTTHPRGRRNFFGLPDFYDYGLDSKGIGDWGLMSYGMWNGVWSGAIGDRDKRRGESPSWVEAWGRVALGWATPVAPAADQEASTARQTQRNGSFRRYSCAGMPYVAHSSRAGP
jgi:M6 family metalloprotease-like protein